MTKFLTALFLSVALISNATANNTPAGQWLTIDDDGVTKKSIMNIWIKDNELQGKIHKILDKPLDEAGNPKTCKKCKGKMKKWKGTPMVDINPLMWNFKRGKSDRHWKNGKILDPKTGKVWKAKMKLIDNGQKLEVRGYWGISLIGRTQTWRRVVKSKPPELEL